MENPAILYGAWVPVDVMTRDIDFPDPCKFVSSTGLVDPSNVNDVVSYVLLVVVYLDSDPAVVKAYVVGSGVLGSSQL